MSISRQDLAMIMAAFLIILVSYVIILYPALCFSTAVGQCRNETVRQLRNMAPIIIIDFLCWLPIVVIGYSALFNKPFVDVSQAKWLVVFVYPFSACTIPFLYVITRKGFLHLIRSLFKHTVSSLQTLPGCSLEEVLQHNTKKQFSRVPGV